MSSEDISIEVEAGPSTPRRTPAGSSSASTSPLNIDIAKACHQFVTELGISNPSQMLLEGLPAPLAELAFPQTESDRVHGHHLLAAISQVLARPQWADLVIKHFDPILLDLLSRWLDNTHGLSTQEWEDRLAVAASLCEIRPDLWKFILSFIQHSPFRSSPLAFLPDNEIRTVDSERLQSLLLAYTRFLTADPDIATRNEWSAEPLQVLRREHQDSGVRLLAIQALSKQQRWSEVRRMEVERDCVGDIDSVDAPVFYGYEVVQQLEGRSGIAKKTVDGWLLPLIETRRVDHLKRSHQDVETAADPEVAPETSFLDESDLSPRVALVADSLLLRSSVQSPSTYQLVHVPTTASTAALRHIAARLPLGDPLLITSPPSSGKTHVLHFLSAQLFPDQQPTNRILTIPLADTTIDVKSLIGTYVSSPTNPGTFEWMEGALAKAIRAGRWVVFDDIDRASMEMLVTIEGLARSLKRGRAGRRARLAVPGRHEIEAGENFALFATRTIRQDVFVPPTFLGHHDFTEIMLESPSDADILSILSASFPQLPRSVTNTLVDAWQRLRSLARGGGQVKGRDIGLRDLEKWCARVQHNLPTPATLAALEQNSAGAFANPVFQDEVLLEASDTFMAALDTRESSAERRALMVEEVGKRIGMDEERAFALLVSRRPQLELSSSSRQLRIGRTTLPIYPSPRRQVVSDGRPFALTKPSLVLLEQIAATTVMGEPTLLVGETGTGKTTAVQHIASICHKPLTVLNLSTQTETSDLLGGFKPIDATVSARVIHTRWQKLFSETFSMAKTQNGAYLEAASKALSGRKWGRLTELWSSSARRAVDKLTKKDESDQPVDPNGQSGSPRKRRKINSRATKAGLYWQSILVDIADFDLHHVKMKSKLVFSFVEGPLVKALREGEWLLLDEVNLASQETLEAISTLLEGTAASLVLTERGDVEPIPRHPDFRLFACMNPATDVGKKDLPPNLRARFTELYVPPPDDDREALTTIVAQYLGDAAAGDKAVILDVVEMYSTLKRLSATKEIVDGSNAAPHYSMRTLARALMFAVQTAPLFGLRRGLWEGCLMAFTMSLDLDSSKRAHQVCEKYLLLPMKNARAVLSQIPTLPNSADPDDYVRFGPFWLKRGPLPPAPESRYIITTSVQSKLSDLARVILTHRYPVLIQGPTSAGKTSAVEYLARQTGHKFVRINNHEHTDIQEYLGTYVTDPQSGNLVFQEGLLVTAVRQGHWIVLDELNLAPTDVLEALNRLLDDNRELVIPETQEVIKPHPNFILFATQNPPGLYAGRKVLSRAFRNRFLEVHFDDVPKDELETILCQRCQIAPSYAKRIVQVFEELRHRRQASRVFESKSSFATLRDLFRWAERGAVGYQQLAEDGYMLLAERARQNEDKEVIKKVIEDVMKVSLNEKQMYRLIDGPESILARLPFETVPKASMVWTNAMQRLFILVSSALSHNEPVLLVGETGCGKTSICEVVALAFEQTMVGVNCHQNMETADLLGSQRPVRNRHERRAKAITALAEITTVPAGASEDDLLKLCEELLRSSGISTAKIKSIQLEIKALSALFEWSDGPLVHAMNNGDLLLLDEVSLADDSVLERLNSVLEPGRTLVLAEKGATDIDEATLVANDKFHVIATMNPGGDFGKKELSPALRNRFTEIWVPPLDDRDDLLQIIGQSWKQAELAVCGPLILDFFNWFGARIGDTAGLGLRDILAWVSFSDRIVARGLLGIAQAFHHGGQMVLVDGLESLPQVSGMSTASVASLRSECLELLSRLASSLSDEEKVSALSIPQVNITSEEIVIGGFGVRRGSLVSEKIRFRLEAPTTALNAMRVLRGCQLPKAILLEGSPGVGKTSLVSALAALAGHHLQRINLSDQTDLIDLFGSDLPVEGGKAGEFQWRDAAFLDAMQRGDWVLLDEMNLASQTVLEGLNAVLDHRGTVFIPELGRSFDRHPNFRVFAAQNPLQQGGGRKGLPKSFLNRFTKVYLQEHTTEDLLLICKELHPIAIETVQKMIAFNEAIRYATMVTRSIGTEGSPWEFNLRDLFRWFSLLSSSNGLELSPDPVEHLRLVYLHRFRNQRDRSAVAALFKSVFDLEIPAVRPTPFLTPQFLQIGHSIVSRAPIGSAAVDQIISHSQLAVAESVLKCVEMGWLVILAGSSGIGKRNLVFAIAESAGRPLGEFAMHPGVDTSEILGSFEQQDYGRLVDGVYEALIRMIDSASDIDPHAGAQRRNLQIARNACIQDKDTESLSRYQDLARALIHVLSTSFNVESANSALRALEKAGPNSTGFAWVDGQLLHAIRNGGWFLISNANLCSASVLDRLNSLCEANGVLVMSEKGSETGSPEVIKPHPDFRLFMTYDPRYGELSRAMRNRGVELYVDSSLSDDQKASSLENTQSAPSPFVTEQALLRDIHVRGPNLTSASASVSLVANEVSLQSLQSASLLRRILSSSKSAAIHVNSFLEDPMVSAYRKSLIQAVSLRRHVNPNLATILPFDASVNPHIHEATINGSFRVLQAFLRSYSQSDEMEKWLADPSNSKSILSISRIASLRGPSRVKPGAGNEVYPFITALRGALVNQVVSIGFTGFDFNALEISSVERIIVLLAILEDRARGETFDYSSTQLLATWLQEAISAVPSLIDAVSQLQSLVKSVKITTGQGQAVLWSLFRREAGENLSEELKATINNVSDTQLRTSILQAMIASQVNPSADASELHTVLNSLPRAPLTRKATSEVWQNWNTLSAVELFALSKLALNSSAAKAIDLLLKDANNDLTSIADIGILTTSKGGPGVMFSALSSWLERLWTHVDLEDSALQGPAAVFGPNALKSVLRFSGTERTSMAELPQQEAALKFTIDSTLWQAKEKPRPREDASRLAVTSLALILSPFGFEFESEQRIEDLAQTLVGYNDSDQIEAWIKEAFNKYLRAPLVAATSQAGSLEVIGELYIGLSHFLLSLYVTNIPIDPAVRRVLLGEIIHSQVTLLEEELAAVENGEIIAKGTANSKRTQDVQLRLQAVIAEQLSLGPSSTRSSDAARLAILFNEVHSFLGDAMGEASLIQLVQALRDGHAQAMPREDGFQAVATAFIHRLKVNYADLRDLVSPIVTAILLAKFGVRSLARNLELRKATQSSAVTSVLTFPSSVTLQNSISTGHRGHDILGQILEISSVARHLDSEASRQGHLRAFVTGLDQLYGTWSEIRLREQREAEEADSLYRVKKTDVEVLSDEDQEAKEFAELFPSFDGETDEDAEPIKAEVKTTSSEDRSKFLQSRISAFHKVLASAFGVGAGHRSTTDPYVQAVDEILHSSFDASAYDESLDQNSLAFRIRQLHRYQAEKQTAPTQPNFYLSPNELEIRKAHSILDRLSQRLTILIEEWPEQMVLQHLLDRVDRVLALDMRSPVARILTALEQLLVHTDDWEAYANRDNSLKSFQNEFSNLIVDWRRLELASWMRLLDDQAEQYIDADAEWTLRLYGALIHGAINATDRNEHIKTVLPLLNTYLNTSTFGHYASRVATLSAFQRMAIEVSGLSPAHSDVLDHVARMLHNVIGHAQLFQVRIADSLRTQRAVLDKAIKDFVKLASWKDVNVFALKASAQKSHRQLHKSIRKFRELLQQPVSPVIADLNSLCPQDAPQASPIPVMQLLTIDPPSESTIATRNEVQLPVPDHLVRLHITFSRYQGILQSAIETRTDQPTIGEDLDTMAVEVIETVAMLQRATPSTLTKENEKIINNLASRKRKAFADLLKALRASGFSNNVRADSLERQQSSTWLAERPNLIVSDLPDVIDIDVVRKVEGYHHKVQVLMVALRAAFNGHNPDINSQDLQRGIGYVESIYATALGVRDSLSAQLKKLCSLSAVLQRLRHLSSAAQIGGGRSTRKHLTDAELDFRRLHAALIEVEEGIRCFRELEGVPVKAGDLAAVHELRQETALLTEALSLVNAASQSVPIFTSGELALLQQAISLKNRYVDSLTTHTRDSPELAHLFEPVAFMATSITIVSPPEANDHLSSTIWKESDDLIQKLLVMAQQIKVDKSLPKQDDDRIHVPNEIKIQQTLLGSLRVSEIEVGFKDFSATLSDSLEFGVSSTASPLIGRVVPFLEALINTYATRLAGQVCDTKSTYKLCYVIGRVMLDLAQKGFCKPHEEDKSKAGDEGETVDGTGMGAGTGDKNVSNEIEEEGQVEGLQGEKEEEKQDGEENEDEDDAVSMDDDFEGDLGEGKEKEENGEEGDEDEEEEDHDEHVGDVDPLDPGAVDEKFWGDEEKEEKEEQGGREDLMNEKNQEESGEAEMSAKDEKNQPNTKEKEKEQKEELKEDGEEGKEGVEQGEGQEEDAPDENQEEEMLDEQDREDGDDGDERDDGPPAHQDEVALPEGDKLDLPEDLNFDDDDDDEMNNEGEDFNDEPLDGEGEDDEGEEGDPEDAEMASNDDGKMVDDAPPAMEPTEEESNEPDAQLNQNLDLSASNESQAQEAADKGQGQGGDQQQKDQVEEKQDDAEMSAEQDESSEAQPPGQGSAPKEAQGGPSAEQELDGPADSSGAPLPADIQAQAQPNRSLGDIMKDIRRRRDEILAQQEREQQSSQPDAPEEAPGQVEYLKEEDQGEDQALGPAGEEERQKLADLNILDEDSQTQAPEAQPGMEDEEEDEDMDANNSAPSARDAETVIKPDADIDDQARSNEKALTQADIGGNGATDRPDEDMEVDDDMEGEVEAKREIEDEDVDSTEIELRDDTKLELVDVNGESTWRQYAALTGDLSYALCEQLRLILEPTLATRLQGDFRTGKRLNMRKIIPYIASEYTKDKIWLRRTKPSRREYQVLLSLDDSRSMADSHSVHLAYQTLALVSQALNKLEVGQVAIAKFGEGVDILHPFGGNGFSDVDGAKVMGSFGFNQHRTDVVALVERTLSFLAEARQTQAASSSAPDLWQLQIIISDGVCQDHHRLRTLLRRALEERVMIVFIIIDSLHQSSTPAQTNANNASSATTAASSRPSILSMQTVEYKSVNGEMQLEMTRYLDTFPFEFFVVLRDVEALPGVLSDTLRQWMARVSQSQE